LLIPPFKPNEQPVFPKLDSSNFRPPLNDYGINFSMTILMEGPYLKEKEDLDSRIIDGKLQSLESDPMNFYPHGCLWRRIERVPI